MARPGKLRKPKTEDDDGDFNPKKPTSSSVKGGSPKKYHEEVIIKVKMLGLQGKTPTEIAALLSMNATSVCRFLGRTSDPRRSVALQERDAANHAAWLETAKARVAAGEVGPAQPVASGSRSGSTSTPKRERDDDDEVATQSRIMSNGTVKKLRFDDSPKGKGVENCKRGTLQPFIAIPQSRSRRSSSMAPPASATASTSALPAASPGPRGSRVIILPPVMPSPLAGPSRSSRAAAVTSQSLAVAGLAPKEAAASTPAYSGPFSASKVPAAYQSSFGAASTSGSLPSSYSNSFGSLANAGPFETSAELTAAITAALPPESALSSSDNPPLVHLDDELPLASTSASASASAAAAARPPEPEPEPAPSTVSTLLGSLGNPFNLLIPFFVAAGCSTALELAGLGKLPREGLEDAVADVVDFAEAPLSEGERGRLTDALVLGKEVAEAMVMR